MADDIPVDAERIQEIIRDEDFIRLTDRMALSLTKKVMSPGTSAEDRERHVMEYHALKSILNQMQAIKDT